MRTFGVMDAICIHESIWNISMKKHVNKKYKANFTADSMLSGPLYVYNRYTFVLIKYFCNLNYITNVMLKL